MIDKALDYEGLKLYNSKVKSEYIKDLTLQDNTITYTKGDGGTGVIELNSGEGNGNADTLDGHDSTYFASKESVDTIQTTSSGTLSQVGWYRVAEYKVLDNSSKSLILNGYYGNRCYLTIHQSKWNADVTETHKILFNPSYATRYFKELEGIGVQYVTKVRHTIDVGNATSYLEMYVSSNNAIGCFIKVDDGKDVENTWQAITPILTSETVDGVTITCVYDIPSNASPATTADLANYLPSNGGTIIGDTSSPLQLQSSDSSMAWLGFKNNNGVDMGAIGYNGENNPYVYLPNVGGKTLIHAGNINNYALPLDGSKAMTGNLSISNTNGSMALMTSTSGIGLMDKSTTKWILRKFGGAYYVDDDKVIIHSGNYTGYITPANIGAAPSSHSHNYAGSSSAGGAATSALNVTSDNTMILYAEKSNEINFGGSNANSSGNIIFGYRAKDSKAIPTNFIFGGSTGTATLQATAFTGTSAKATADANGNNIADTYATKTSLGTQVTYSLEGTTLYINTK